MHRTDYEIKMANVAYYALKCVPAWIHNNQNLSLGPSLPPMVVLAEMHSHEHMYKDLLKVFIMMPQNHTSISIIRCFLTCRIK